MRVSAQTCRAQEAVQRAKASTEPLESRRKIALDAAKAWATEAVLAETRESKRTPLDLLDAEIALEFAMEIALETEDPEASGR